MGEVFAGRYELVDPIGRGGVGAVWRSWDHRRRRYVAAKVLQQRDAHALLRFVREQALRIDHPHVLAPASWAADDDKVLFTMDLVRGGSLSHLIGDHGPLPPRQVTVLLDQLLAGLGAVHAEGVVHRDIKPANVLLEATGTGTPHVRLSDFGISMRKGDPRLTEADYVVGTPGYFAPEQLLGAEPDFPADLYAVGLVALYLLSGRKPDAQAIQERFLASGMPPAPLGVPDPLWQVVGALLQPDPYARFRTATGARKALAAAVELLPDAEGEPPIEVFDRIGPLPEGFGPDGPLTASSGRHAMGPPLAFGAAIGGQQLPAPGDRAPSPQPPAGPPTFPPVPLTPPDPTPAGALPPPPRTPPLAPPPSPPSTPPNAPRSAPPKPAEAPSSGVPLLPAPAQQPLPDSGPAAHVPAGSPTGEPLTHPRTRLDVPAPLPLPSPAPGPVPPAAPTPAPAAQADTASARLPATRPRPGPPARIAIPVLLLALICFAVGIAALAAS
ncbi:serine/threonine-protein kinase [Actinacidiphila guanduensis]|uniref:non-specific serine/threonine protein kinase n=1 Tax=Actinacidiphila guanduensis TaxID=310781 RepID=A0A1G9XJM2_9ACTN|nr:serine/threonine-protein kinase [Actinacidiphila guanduensis]SDM96473.1 Serine/threonine protein kinase [Actinacidiphila guanduensis]